MNLLNMTQGFQNARVSKECKRCSPSKPPGLGFLQGEGCERKGLLLEFWILPDTHTHLLTAPVWGPTHSQKLKHLHKEQLTPVSKQQEVSECTGEQISELGDSTVLLPLIACAPQNTCPFSWETGLFWWLHKRSARTEFCWKKPQLGCIQPRGERQELIQIVAVREKASKRIYECGAQVTQSQITVVVIVPLSLFLPHPTPTHLSFWF